MTGHCAYSLGCGRWREGCGECPDLTIPPAIELDATRANLERKREIFAKSRLYISAETNWMLDRAKQSVLAPAAVDWRHIPGGADLSVFAPGSRSRARERFRLGAADQVLLFSANQGAGNRYKDFATVRAALEALRDRPQRTRGKIVLLVAGGSALDEWIGPNILIRHVGYVDTRARMAALYRACDLLVHAAVEETFGNVVAEAMACGRAVVVASGGGVVELIEHGRTGLVVPPRQPALLADAIGQLLDDPARRAEMGAAAEAAARVQLDGATTVANLLSWFTEIHAAWHERAERRARL
jgi:glycosyltransferase involved in cell wall biosynthesis